MHDRLSILGLFPDIGPDAIGGVQLSGRLAWQGLRSSINEDQRWLFCYGASGSGTNQQAEEETTITDSRLSAIRAAIVRRRHPALILIWHIDLLKLVPFFRASRARIFLFLHGIEAWRRQDVLTRMLLRRVDWVLTNSDYTWKRALSWSPSLKRARHQTVHLGVGQPKQVQCPPDDRPVALMLGRLMRGEDYKGHCELIAIWPKVLRMHENAELWIAGDGDLRPDLEALVARLGLNRSVRFWGKISEEQKQELLITSRCLAMPSRGEGFGLVYLEAMRLGRPCLVSTLDAGREVINPPEAGLAADPDDPQDLADTLSRLLTSGPEWDQWSRQARRRYEEMFTSSHFQQRLSGALFSGHLAIDPAFHPGP